MPRVKEDCLACLSCQSNAVLDSLPVYAMGALRRGEGRQMPCELGQIVPVVERRWPWC
jgi:hypothetical protein